MWSQYIPDVLLIQFNSFYYWDTRMPQKYAPQAQTIETLLSWVKSKEIAIPEIQRPFVWDSTKVRNLLDSLFQGYPVGYLITWKNPDINLKDGSRSVGKKILIDGQQRVTALMAALLGEEVVTKEYKRVRIRIAFNPQKCTFEVKNPAIEKDPAWISDISVLFDRDFYSTPFVQAYCEKNSEASQRLVDKAIHDLTSIVHNPVGIIELDSSLDIETVTEIFIRVNSAGVALSQADFAMSKIAVNETHNGPVVRKAIDYFCHLAVAPDFYGTMERNDQAFAASEYFSKMSWLRHENDNLYDPSYSDMLRVAFTSQFRRGRLQDLVALLSGRNFETKQYEEQIVDETFSHLSAGIHNFINETNFKNLIMTVRSAGFVDASLIRSQMALNFAYILYLTLRNQHVPHGEIERQVRRWFVLSLLTGRYSSSPESTFDLDIRQISANGIHEYAETIIQGQLSDAFWEVTLPQAMNTSSTSSPYFNIYCAAQVKQNDCGFLSRDITVKELIEYKSDVHHIFPRDLLVKAGLPRAQYNQIANYVIAQSEINIHISNKEPALYFQQVIDQTVGGKQYYGNINDPESLQKNLVMNCIPEGMERITIKDYQEFLVARRRLMALKIRDYFYSL